MKTQKFFAGIGSIFGRFFVSVRSVFVGLRVFFLFGALFFIFQVVSLFVVVNDALGQVPVPRLPVSVLDTVDGKTIVSGAVRKLISDVRSLKFTVYQARHPFAFAALKAPKGFKTATNALTYGTQSMESANNVYLRLISMTKKQKSCKDEKGKPLRFCEYRHLKSCFRAEFTLALGYYGRTSKLKALLVQRRRQWVAFDRNVSRSFAQFYRKVSRIRYGQRRGRDPHFREDLKTVLALVLGYRRDFEKAIRDNLAYLKRLPRERKQLGAWLKYNCKIVHGVKARFCRTIAGP